MVALLDTRHPRASRLVLASKAIGLSIAIAFALPAQHEDPLLRASEALAGGSAGSAAEILEDFVQQHPSSADGHRLLGIALSLLDRRSSAIEALERSAELGPGNPSNHLALGQVLSRLGSNERAEHAFRTALDLDSSLGPAHEGLALVLALRGAIGKSLTHFSSALEHTNQQRARARLHFYRGRAYAQSDHPAAASRDFEAAITLDPGLGPAHLELGRVLADGEEREKAIAALRKAAELVAGSFDAHFLLGSALLRNGEAAAAVAALRRATELNPSDQPAAYALGRALRASGRTEEARHHLAGIAKAGARRALDEATVTEAGRLNDLGIAAEASGELERALAHYLAAIEIAPDNVLIQRNAALVLSRLERWDEAKERLRAVLRMAPGDIDATTALHIALDHAPDER